MRVLMLGWEFPPYIAGGLGTACHGLTRALNGMGLDVLFVLPRPVAHGNGRASVAMVGPTYPFASRTESAAEERQEELKAAAAPAEAEVRAERGEAPSAPAPPMPLAQTPPEMRPAGTEVMAPPLEAAEPPPTAPEFERLSHVRFRTLDVLLRPYMTEDEYRAAQVARARAEQEAHLPANERARREARAAALARAAGDETITRAEVGTTFPPAEPGALQANARGGVSEARSITLPPSQQYRSEMVAEVQRYADLVRAIAEQEEDLDVIHAHDWMTFRAGMAAADATGAPLIVHVHSTEYDRAGQHVNPEIVEIERAGMHAAARVVAVSNLTRRLLIARYGVPQEKIDVIHNAIDAAPECEAESPHLAQRDKIVLFLGRVTQQKGPEYFLAAARRVLDVKRDVKFFMAGAGDMIRPTIELAAAMGIGNRVMFTGFLNSRDVERVYQMADLYVMPSVSEPFGIAPLEAMAHDVPVIVSKQSGVAEVIQHALKVDFWDTDELANKILAVLRHPPLAKTLRKNARAEVHKMSWHDAAVKLVALYDAVAGERVAVGEQDEPAAS